MPDQRARVGNQGYGQTAPQDFPRAPDYGRPDVPGLDRPIAGAGKKAFGPTFSPRMVWSPCGTIGAFARPNWQERLEQNA